MGVSGLQLVHFGLVLELPLSEHFAQFSHSVFHFFFFLAQFVILIVGFFVLSFEFVLLEGSFFDGGEGFFMELGESSFVVFGEGFVFGSFDFEIVDLFLEVVDFGVFGFDDFVSVSGRFQEVLNSFVEFGEGFLFFFHLLVQFAVLSFEPFRFSLLLDQFFVLGRLLDFQLGSFVLEILNLFVFQHHNFLCLLVQLVLLLG